MCQQVMSREGQMHHSADVTTPPATHTGKEQVREKREGGRRRTGETLETEQYTTQLSQQHRDKLTRNDASVAAFAWEFRHVKNDCCPVNCDFSSLTFLFLSSLFGGKLVLYFL